MTILNIIGSISGNPVYTILGLLLFITAFVFIIRNIRKGRGDVVVSETETAVESEDDSLFIEKDVLMMDKPRIQRDYESYEPLKKFNLGVIVLIVMGLIGLALIYYGSTKTMHSEAEVNPAPQEMIESDH